jgi:PII-like signaling protein
MIPPDNAMLCIYLNVNDKCHRVELYRAIIEAARHFPIAGASVFPVEVGYGAHRRIHDAASEYTSFEIPIVIELVDTAAKLSQFGNELQTMMREGLLTLRPVRIVRYTHALEQESADSRAPSSDPVPLQVTKQNEEGSKSVKIEGEARRVTAYIGSADTWGGRNLAMAIVEQCRKLGMAGVTVSRGIMGFGKHSIIHKAHFLGLSDDLPEKIEVVDRAEAIDRLLPVLDAMMGGGLIVIEDVHVARYCHDEQKSR